MAAIAFAPSLIVANLVASALAFALPALSFPSLSNSASSLSTFLPNTTSPLTDNLPLPICNGSLLGTNLNLESCRSALWSIPPKGGRREFGDRAFGDYDIPLPRRWLSPDGLCAIDVFHRDGYTRDVASMAQIWHAANRLLQTCLKRPGGADTRQGGYIRDVGQNQNLVVVLSSYNPSVNCIHGRTASRKNSAQDILDIIPVGTDKQIFGPEGEPGVQVTVPMTFSEPRVVFPSGRKAIVDVQTRHAVTARWFDLWAGAVAVDAICVQAGMTGVATLDGGLSITIR